MVMTKPEFAKKYGTAFCSVAYVNKVDLGVALDMIVANAAAPIQETPYKGLPANFPYKEFIDDYRDAGIGQGMLEWLTFDNLF